MNEIPNFTGEKAIPRFRSGLLRVPVADRRPPRRVVADVSSSRSVIAVQDEIRHLHPVGRRSSRRAPASAAPANARPHAGTARDAVSRPWLRMFRNILGGAAAGAGGRQPPSDGSASRVVVRLPHRQRIQPERVRDLVHHPLDPQHPLRPAEAAKGGGASMLVLSRCEVIRHRRQQVGVVGVQHRPVGDRQRQVLAQPPRVTCTTSSPQDPARSRRTRRRNRCGNRAACR